MSTPGEALPDTGHHPPGPGRWSSTVTIRISMSCGHSHTYAHLSPNPDLTHAAQRSRRWHCHTCGHAQTINAVVACEATPHRAPVRQASHRA